MTVHVTDVYDQERECGWRRPGFYAMGSGETMDCGKLPHKLEPCDHCGLQVKLTRGLQKVSVRNLFQHADCRQDKDICQFCPLNIVHWGYLIGVGAKHYKTHQIFENEAILQGISKRIAWPLPREFKVGESTVLIGHPKVFTELVPEEAIEQPVPEIDEDAPQKALPMIEGHALTTGRLIAKDIPAIVMVFIPQRVEYVTDGTEPDSFLELLVDQGVVPVKVHRVDESLAQMEIESV